MAPPPASAKIRVLRLRSRQIDHRITVYKVGDQEDDPSYKDTYESFIPPGRASHEPASGGCVS